MYIKATEVIINKHLKIQLRETRAIKTFTLSKKIARGGTPAKLIITKANRIILSKLF